MAVSSMGTPEPGVDDPTADMPPEEAIEYAVREWADSWSRQDLAAYLGSYAEDFDVPNGLSRIRWERQRAVRLSKPEFIRISISDLRIHGGAAGGPRNVSFNQGYESNTYRDQVRKNLQMVRSDSGWKIRKETSNP